MKTMILVAAGAMALTACSNAEDAPKTKTAAESGMEASTTAPATDGAMAPADASPGSAPTPDATGTTTEPTGDATAPGRTPPVLPTDPQDATSPPRQ